MIQNANDAEASVIEVHFYTDGSTGACKSILIRNNGKAFSEDDWVRLQRIAEGNPDEQKVKLPMRKLGH